MNQTSIAGQDDLILVTGASGFIGQRVVTALLERGYSRLRCLVRPSSRSQDLQYLQDQAKGRRVEIQVGNLLSPSDCAAAVRDVSVIYHLAAGRGEKFFADAFLNSG